MAEANLSFILDLHYSDWWADPLHQAKPLAWQERATHPPLVVVIPSLLPATEVPLSSLSALGFATAGAETHPPRLYPPHRRRLCGAGYAACGGAGPCIRAHVRRTVHEQRDCWPRPPSQVGNEITFGMLWERPGEACARGGRLACAGDLFGSKVDLAAWRRLGALVDAGMRGVREACPRCEVATLDARWSLH